jgi:serine protease
MKKGYFTVCLLSVLFGLILGSCSSGGGGGGSQPAPPTVTVSATVGQQGQFLPGFDGTSQRPMATVVDEKGNEADFVENELWLSTNDSAALDAFVSRWTGSVVAEFKPADYGLTGLDNQYLVRVDASSADTAKLTDDLLALDPNSRGAHRVSSENGLRLLAAGAHEAAAGLTVGVNWVGRGDVFWDRVSMEALPAGNNSNAFTWTTHSAGSVQDIGVGEAWRALEFAGKLSNKVKIAILDMGFSPDADVPSDWFAISNVPFVDPTGVDNLLSCGGPCPWHGTNVTSAAMAMPNNSYGAAGPAGPVASPVLVFTLYDFFTSMTALGEARLYAGAKIANMSYSTRVPASLSWSVLPFDAVTFSYRNSGMLLFAAAGNDGKNVDAEDLFWEEAWHTPCENHGVICVGGLANNSTSRDFRSNYGRENVDIYAPFSLWAGPDPSSANSQWKSGTSFSSPFVAGIAALVWAADPGLSASQVENILMETAHTSRDSTVNRVVHAFGAVHRALGDIPPGVRIVSPAGGAIFTQGAELASFSARFDDYEDGTTGTIHWTSSIDGPLGTGTWYDNRWLTIGTHVITASATDSGGNTSSDSVNVTIVGATPVVTITSISPASPIYQSQSISLHGYSYDPSSLAPLSDADVSWTVDGSGTPFNGGNMGHLAAISGGVLSIGTHTVVFTGTNGSNTASDSTTISIIADTAGNIAPTPILTSPADGSSYLADQYDSATGKWYKNITFCGHGVDPEDGEIWGSRVQWDYRLSPGGGIFQNLGAGTGKFVKCPSFRLDLQDPSATTTYEIRLSVTDSGGLTSSMSIYISLNGLI